MAQQLRLGVHTLSELLGAPPTDYARLVEELHQYDATATDLHYALLTRMRSSFINPLPPEDLYALSRLIGEAMEKLDGAGELLALYNLNRLSPRAADQLEVIGRQAELTIDAMKRLNSLEDLEEYWIEVLRLAKRAEKTHRVWVSELFQEHKVDTYLKHRDIANQLVDVSKDLRRVANYVGSVLVKEA